MSEDLPRRQQLDEAVDGGEFARRMLDWFEAHRRELPWRDDPTPYRVWVSEIMLQQTQVTTVLPYFSRWMERFPSVHDLAEADLDEVLTLWSGLGYYRRARMLHRAARVVVDEYGGEVPGTVKGLVTLPGVGRYTAGAVASIAFGLPAPLVDGNVIRVVARLFAIDGDVRKSAAQKEIWAIAERAVPEEAPGDFNQALMELGSLVCGSRKASCLLCPMSDLCVGYAEGVHMELPFKSSKKARRPMIVASAVVEGGEHGHVLLTRRPPSGLFGGLWEFPGVEVDAEAASDDPAEACRGALSAFLAERGLEAAVGEGAGRFDHTLSHIDLSVFPFRVEVEDTAAFAEVWERPAEWVPPEEVEGRALSSIMRTVASGVLDEG